ncbi:hypothetical protein DAEQUDRAFT_587886 [Daedalea quercina L-15889]|uniref:Uncharacterized protein n=1 Tax=Daedalea quercina L-15889 TaxID=1314783 RepID=A0A165SUM7_9APHY|nr:hypothetical protein DAEQUDRAFT_587886 [Daedalea quercina L-15889]
MVRGDRATSCHHASCVGRIVAASHRKSLLQQVARRLRAGSESTPMDQDHGPFRPSAHRNRIHTSWRDGGQRRKRAVPRRVAMCLGQILVSVVDHKSRRASFMGRYVQIEVARNQAAKANAGISKHGTAPAAAELQGLPPMQRYLLLNAVRVAHIHPRPQY